MSSPYREKGERSRKTKKKIAPTALGKENPEKKRPNQRSSQTAEPRPSPTKERTERKRATPPPMTL